MSDKHNCSKTKTQERIKVKKLCAKDARIKNGIIDNLSVSGDTTLENLIVTENSSLNNVNVNNLNAENASINALQVTTLNGRNLSCEQSFQNINSPIVTENPLEYPEGSIFNKQVWDKLALETLKQKTDLAERLQCGRLYGNL